MRTPQQWLGELSGSLDPNAVPLNISDSDIKAIQDEAFKAGMETAAELAGNYLQSMGTRDGMKVASLIQKDILTQRDKLPT